MKLRARTPVRQCYALHSRGEKFNLSKQVAWSKLACTIILVTRNVCWTIVKILYDQHTNDKKKTKQNKAKTWNKLSSFVQPTLDFQN